MDEIEKKLRRILSEHMKVDESLIDSDDLLCDANIDTDDISFIFIPEVESVFDVKFSVKQWANVGSLREISELIKSDSEKGS